MKIKYKIALFNFNDLFTIFNIEKQNFSNFYFFSDAQ